MSVTRQIRASPFVVRTVSSRVDGVTGPDPAPPGVQCSCQRTSVAKSDRVWGALPNWATTSAPDRVRGLLQVALMMPVGYPVADSCSR